MKKQEDILLGKRIKAIRSELKLDQSQFSELIGSSVSALSNWENGRNKPNDVMLHAIASIGDISVDELLLGDENEIIKRTMIEMVKKDEHDLLSQFIVYLNKFNTAYSDFYNDKVYHFGNYTAANSFEHNAMKRIIAGELFENFINKISIEEIKEKTNNWFFYSADEKDERFRDDVALMLEKYFDLIIFEDDKSFEGRVLNLLNTIKHEFPYHVIGHSNLDDYIVSNLKNNDDDSRETIIKFSIDFFFYQKAHLILNSTRQELSNLLDDYEKAIDKYLNNDQ